MEFHNVIFIQFHMQANITLSILIFNSKNQLLLRQENHLWSVSCAIEKFENPSISKLLRAKLQTEFQLAGEPKELFTFANHLVFFYKTERNLEAEDSKYMNLATLFQPSEVTRSFSPTLKAILENGLKDHLHHIVYNGQKNVSQRFKYHKVHEFDLGLHSPVYQSQLCRAIKARLRPKEGKIGAPGCLDFGAVRYHIANHFGFCLGVANAIDIAYQALAENPTKQVYITSELIHNPFVNADLKNRGLLFLQNDKGVRYKDAAGNYLWDKLAAEDIVIIPAFGTSIPDKNRLIAKGIDITQYDATCRLVENVWLRGKKLGQEGFTIILHGKSEHEETRATFSYINQYAPIIIVRDCAEAEKLHPYIQSPYSAELETRFKAEFAPDAYGNPKFSADFDISKHLKRIAVVNQTTLLAQETLTIAKGLKHLMSTIYGIENVDHHFGKTKDTLCYATNANQGALLRLLEQVEAQIGIVVGGKNSSNTSQLYKLLQERVEDTFYIQSEADILNSGGILSYDIKSKTTQKRIFKRESKPLNIVLTGGASCPDGLIQQIITRINSFYPAEELNSIDYVLQHLED